MYQFASNPFTHRLDLVNDRTCTLFVAGEAVGGHRIVTLNNQGEVIHADRTIPGHAGRLCGLTLASAVAGAPVAVQSHGLVTDPSWQWDVSKPRLFLSTQGTLTQTVPTSGFLCVVGFCVSETQLFVDIQPAIQLN